MTNTTNTARRAGAAPAFPVYLTAAVLARTADEGARVALVMLATQRASSPALGGALVAALMIPHVAAAPVAGALADSVRRRRLFHGGAVTLYGAALAALAVLVGRAYDLVALLPAVAAGCVAPLLTGGLTGLLGEFLSKERLTRAFSADAVSYNLAGICGPAVAAALGTAVGAGTALAALGAGAMTGGMLLAGMPSAADVAAQVMTTDGSAKRAPKDGILRRGKRARAARPGTPMARPVPVTPANGHARVRAQAEPASDRAVSSACRMSSDSSWAAGQATIWSATSRSLMFVFWETVRNTPKPWSG